MRACVGACVQRETAASITTAVESCTARHKRAQQDAIVRASEALRRALEAAGLEAEARTKAALERYDFFRDPEVFRVDSGAP